MDVSKKYKLFLEDSVTSLKKAIKIYKNEETSKIKLIKEKIIVNLMVYNDKSLSHISDFISCFETIANSNTIIDNEINEVFIKNFKEFKLPDNYINKILKKPEVNQNQKSKSKDKQDDEKSVSTTATLISEQPKTDVARIVVINIFVII